MNSIVNYVQAEIHKTDIYDFIYTQLLIKTSAIQTLLYPLFNTYSIRLINQSVSLNLSPLNKIKFHLFTDFPPTIKN